MRWSGGGIRKHRSEPDYHPGGRGGNPPGTEAILERTERENGKVTGETEPSPSSIKAINVDEKRLGLSSEEDSDSAFDQETKGCIRGQVKI